MLSLVKAKKRISKLQGSVVRTVGAGRSAYPVQDGIRTKSCCHLKVIRAPRFYEYIMRFHGAHLKLKYTASRQDTQP